MTSLRRIRIQYINHNSLKALALSPENLGKLSDEQDERFHQEMASIEKRFHGKIKTQMLAVTAGHLSAKLTITNLNDGDL